MNLLTSGRLNDYLADIEEQAQGRFERIVELICNFTKSAFVRTYKGKITDTR